MTLRVIAHLTLLVAMWSWAISPSVNPAGLERAWPICGPTAELPPLACNRRPLRRVLKAGWRLVSLQPLRS